MRLKRTVAVVAGLNLAYFGIEAVVAHMIGSVSLFADSVDFLEDAAVNFLVFLAIGWSAARRRAVGLVLAAIIVLPGLAALATILQKLMLPTAVAPAAFALSVTGGGALLVNGLAALLLARVRHAGGSLSRAAFLSARNDVAANLGIIGAGLATAATNSIWPDIVVGIAIMIINFDAAREVIVAARGERDDDDKPEPLAPRP